TLLLAEEAEQEVFGAHVAVSELSRLTHRERENLLCTRRIRQIRARGGARLALLHRVLDLLFVLVEVYAEILKDGRGHALTLPDEAEQDVLCAHVLVMEPSRFLARHCKDLSDPLREIVAVHRFLDPRLVPRLTLLSPPRLPT